MKYGSPTKLRIDWALMLLNFNGIEQYLHTNISKYGVGESTSSMEVLKKVSDDRSHLGSFMKCAATTRVILYWKPETIYYSHIPSCLIS